MLSVPLAEKWNPSANQENAEILCLSALGLQSSNCSVVNRKLTVNLSGSGIPMFVNHTGN